MTHVFLVYPVHHLSHLFLVVQAIQVFQVFRELLGRPLKQGILVFRLFLACLPGQVCLGVRAVLVFLHDLLSPGVLASPHHQLHLWDQLNPILQRPLYLRSYRLRLSIP